MEWWWPKKGRMSVGLECSQCSSSAPLGQLIMPLSHIFLLAVVVLSLAPLARCQTPRSLRRFCKLKGALKVQTPFSFVEPAPLEQVLHARSHLLLVPKECWRIIDEATSRGEKERELQSPSAVRWEIWQKTHQHNYQPFYWHLARYRNGAALSTLQQVVHCGVRHGMQSNVSLPPLLRFLPHLALRHYAIGWQCQS